jgi:hypothetical protein
MANALTFANSLLAQGIEVHRRANGRLYLWHADGDAFKRLSHADRATFAALRAELKELVATGLAPRLPEPGDTASGEAVAITEVREPAPSADAFACGFCRRDCVGQDHPAYRVLHWDDPTEVARRDAAATALMRKRVAYGA